MDRISALKTSLKDSTLGICLVAASNGNHMNIALMGSESTNRVNILTRRP